MRAGRDKGRNPSPKNGNGTPSGARDGASRRELHSDQSYGPLESHPFAMLAPGSRKPPGDGRDSDEPPFFDLLVALSDKIYHEMLYIC